MEVLDTCTSSSAGSRRTTCRSHVRNALAALGTPDGPQLVVTVQCRQGELSASPKPPSTCRDAVCIQPPVLNKAILHRARASANERPAANEPVRCTRLGGRMCLDAHVTLAHQLCPKQFVPLLGQQIILEVVRASLSDRLGLKDHRIARPATRHAWPMAMDAARTPRGKRA